MPTQSIGARPLSVRRRISTSRREPGTNFWPPCSSQADREDELYHRVTRKPNSTQDFQMLEVSERKKKDGTALDQKSGLDVSGELQVSN